MKSTKNNMLTPTLATPSAEKLGAIDCLRGYAILLVFLSHTLLYIPELVWPVKRLLLMGFYGVQLFFLASALTLMMSWQKSQDPLLHRSSSFFIRRFFRIAPLYYLAVPFYIVVHGAELSELDLSTLFASIFFFNAWVPGYTYPQNNWAPVPGGWSISVEFAFYFIFPLLMCIVRSLRSALWLLATSILLMIFTRFMPWHQDASLSVEEMSLFLYYSPFNQFAVFSLGIVLYWLIKQPWLTHLVKCSKLSTNTASSFAFLIFFGLSFYGQHRLFDIAPFAIPTHLIASILFFAWAAFLILKPEGAFLNCFVIAIGKVSFGIYLIHFASLYGVDKFLMYVGWTDKNGMYGIAYLAVLTLAALVLSYGLAKLAYRTIEEPCLGIGHRIANRIGLSMKTKAQIENGVSKIS